MRNFITNIKSHIKPWVMGVLVSALSALVAFGLFNLSFYIDDNNQMVVPGTVYAKGYITKKHKYYAEDVLNLAIKPDNPKYKHYSVIVDFSTYSDLDVGDKAAFKVSKSKVTDISNGSNFLAELLCVTVFISAVIVLIGGLGTGLYLISDGNKWQ